jgi:plasmid stability protein
MATLYVENVPDDLYEALRQRARASRRSISAETVLILQQMVPTPAEQRRRAAFYRRVRRIRSQDRHAAPGPSVEELLRQDRRR